MEISHQLYSISNLSKQCNKVASILLLAALHCALLDLQQMCADPLGCGAILATLGVTVCNKVGIHVVWGGDGERFYHWVADDVLLVEEGLV